jgi:hypothetical protein
VLWLGLLSSQVVEPSRIAFSTTGDVSYVLKNSLRFVMNVHFHFDLVWHWKMCACVSISPHVMQVGSLRSLFRCSCFSVGSYLQHSLVVKVLLVVLKRRVVLIASQLML